MSKEFWEKARAEVEDNFKQVFGDKCPLIELQYHENDYADNDITIAGVVSLFQVEYEIISIRGYDNEMHWQLGKVWYTPGTYHDPPDGGIDEVGEPHKHLSDAIREAVKLYAEYAIDSHFEFLADQELARQLEEEGSYERC